jgi:hypothetical protein
MAVVAAPDCHLTIRWHGPRNSTLLTPQGRTCRAQAVIFICNPLAINIQNCDALQERRGCYPTDDDVFVA